ncbi:AcrB/AcrD/AcrF family protein [Methylobacterium sp. 275MFSha3.1]|nr:AcrB/AcrD/AcrF family protein [Methylobacterium sp. 275MFSha3.1]
MAGGPARRIPRSTRRKTSLRSPGVIPALTLRGVPFSISAATDFSALFGIAILNDVVLASYPRPGGVRLRRSEAATRAAALRLQPVMMTALTAALGFLPMALATSAGAEVQRPLAIVIIRCLIAATLLTLVPLPAVDRAVAGLRLPFGVYISGTPAPGPATRSAPRWRRCRRPRTPSCGKPDISTASAALPA